MDEDMTGHLKTARGYFDRDFVRFASSNPAASRESLEPLQRLS
jgi:hypothetical protein